MNQAILHGLMMWLVSISVGMCGERALTPPVDLCGEWDFLAEHGRGEVLFFMLQTAGRYDPADANFDPVVERLMMNVLGY